MSVTQRHRGIEYRIEAPHKGDIRWTWTFFPKKEQGQRRDGTASSEKTAKTDCIQQIDKFLDGISN